LKKYILAIDIGTTSAKGLAVTTTGDVLTSQQVFYPTHYPKPGYAEQDPVAICNGVFTLIETVISQNRSTAQIEGISLSAAMHSLMAASEEGDPLSPLIIWADTRSSKEAVELRNSELGPVLHYQTGAPIHPMTPLCKLLWMKEHDPKFIKAPRLISIKEFFVKKLTGEFLVDYSILIFIYASGIQEHFN
jgi:gluconokinase